MDIYERATVNPDNCTADFLSLWCLVYCDLFPFHTIILRNLQVEISREFCKMRPNGEILIRDHSAFVCDTQGKATAEHGRAVASVWVSVCLCASENPGTCAPCRMRNLGLESFCCNWVFLLSVCPCVLSTHVASPWVCQSRLCMGFSPYVGLPEEEPTSK